MSFPPVLPLVIKIARYVCFIYTLMLKNIDEYSLFAHIKLNIVVRRLKPNNIMILQSANLVGFKRTSCIICSQFDDSFYKIIINERHLSM